MYKITGLCFGVLASTLLAVGNVLQKKGNAWIGRHNPLKKKYFRPFVIWLLGSSLIALSLIPNAIASKHLPPYIVAATVGWGLVVVITLSYFLLKEDLRKTDLFYTTVIVACIVWLNLVQKEVVFPAVNKKALYLAFLIPFFLSALSLIRDTSRKDKAAIWAVFSGMTGGFSYIVLHAFMKEGSLGLSSFYNTIYPLLYLVSGMASFLGLQIAYKFGKMILVSPLQLSMTIIYPVFCTYLIFSSPILLAEIITILLLIAACTALNLSHSRNNGC